MKNLRYEFIGKHIGKIRATTGKEFEFVVTKDGCFECVSHSLTNDGYVRCKLNKKSTTAHRVIYEKRHGKIPSGLIIRHSCDNKQCINIEHFELGTYSDNVRDRVDKDRSAQGEFNGRAKLNNDIVRYIRTNPKLSINSLAKQFNVTWKAIAKIRKNETWRHVTI